MLGVVQKEKPYRVPWRVLNVASKKKVQFKIVPASSELHDDFIALSKGVRAARNEACHKHLWVE
jgi:hypothetical protein